MTLALIVLVPKNGRSWQSRYILTLVLGWLCGITVINNLDFGLPLLAAVLISSFAASNKWKDAAVTALLIVTGCITFAITYVMLALFTANEVTWSLMLLFPSFHGLEGFFAFPMAPLGPHIAVATLFCITTVIGLGMSINKRHSISIRTRRQWLWMAMAGLWSLISLAYFSGRSYSSTLMAGSGLMVGVCLSSMLPAIRLSLRRAYRSVETHPKLDYVPALFGVLALLLVTGLWATVERPSAYIASAANQPWSLEGPMANIGNDVRSRIASAPVKVRSLIELGDVSQFLWNSNLVELSFPNLPSWGVGNSPQWMSISKKFLDLQCANPLPSETQYAWVSRQEIEAMMESEICTSQFSLGDLIPFSASSADVLVPTRRP